MTVLAGKPTTFNALRRYLEEHPFLQVSRPSPTWRYDQAMTEPEERKFLQFTKEGGRWVMQLAGEHTRRISCTTITSIGIWHTEMPLKGITYSETGFKCPYDYLPGAVIEFTYADDIPKLRALETALSKQPGHVRVTPCM